MNRQVARTFDLFESIAKINKKSNLETKKCCIFAVRTKSQYG